jgi:zinc transporter ZupT
VIFSPAIWVTFIAVLCAWLGVSLSSVHSVARRLVPFGGGTLIGVALFWVLPEMAETVGGASALTWLGAGVALLLLVDRYVYPVCPACSPAHDHDHCSTTLHGFATPLFVASAVHAALDGWNLAASQDDAGLGFGVLAAIGAHKIPEGLALGVIARASLGARSSAMFWSAAAQLATLVGAAAEGVVAPYLSVQLLHGLLALAGGSFLYLGWHAVHGEFRRRGASPALVPALTGVAGSSVLRWLLR